MSKRVFQHPPETTGGRKYWRSLGQLADTPEFRGWLEREFPQGASEINGSEVSRRSFLSLMGASAALAGLSLTGCRRPEKHLVPFTRGAEWSIPGKALFFATSMPTRRGYSPLVATTYDGRPTKIEGNPLHPVSKGATGLYEQASILDLYDPDRTRQFTHKGAVKTAAEFEKATDELIAASGDGDGLAFLLEENNSPTRERLRLEIEKKFPKAIWAVYEPVGASSEAGDVAFGAGNVAKADLAKADVILSLDCDFLGQEGDTADARAFASRRKVDDGNTMNRLYVVENRYTVTGGMADHRLRIPASQIGAALLELASFVGAKGDAALNAVLGGAPKLTGTLKAWLGPCADDLLKNAAKSLVLVGERQPAAVRALAYSINAALGNIGKTITGARAFTKPAATIARLAQELGDKKVKTLVILGGNPVYNAPADLDFAGKLKALGEAVTVVNVTLNPNETTAVATWQAPLAHYLESWGDGYAGDGSYVSVQPMILPLFGGWSEHDVLAKFAGQPKPTGPELIKETFRQVAKPTDFATAWPKFLHDGFVPAAATAAASLTLSADSVGKLVKENYPQAVLNGDAFELVLIADASVDDGRYANNGWLQEFPDPITKLTWDNAAQISPKSAKKLGVELGDIVEITIDNTKLEIPVIISPGHADNSLSIPLGYGRTAAGRVGTVAATTERYVFSDDIISGGFNAYPLTTSAESYIRVGAKVRAVGRSYPLAVTQEHGSLEGRGADLLREGTVETYKENPEFAQTLGMDAHIPPNRSLYKHPALDDIHQWGMTVDLNACIGCGTCMVACQAENNIPIVGKRQVIDGREMHWIRCDRYFASGPETEKGPYDHNVDDPEMVSQPMMCQHCENAPCETVCPVNATVHSEDGINVMAYNRCIGTRYCANNCPFKVRRFNFFDYNQRQLDHLRKWNLISEKGMEDTLKLSKNPNVTVRMRGVMEKCTFCVQRVQEAKIATKAKARGSADVKIPTDSFTVACAQSCPTEAIVFGDISDKESAVSKVRASARAYELLKYLNINTRVLYLARIRNPNPDLVKLQSKQKIEGANEVGEYIKPAHHHGSGTQPKSSNGGTL
jgi:molybdopterin-containing oxidoreductase family iron-sulfur binding subunit